MQHEIRALAGLELRADGEVKKLVGYAAVFNSMSEDLGGFREIVAPGAFKRSLKDRPDVFALADHDTSRRLGRTTNETLVLREDDRGLHVEIMLPDTQTGRDIHAEVRGGLIDAMSFGFSTRTDKWEKKEGATLRTLEDVDLFEVSVVAFPAYRATSIDLAKRSLDRWNDNQNAAARIAADARASRMRMRLRLAAA